MRDENGEVFYEDIKFKLYDYSEASYGFTADPETDFGFPEIRGKKIDGSQVYMFAKSNERDKSRFEKITGIKPVSAPKSEYSEELSNKIPAEKLKENLHTSLYNFILNI